MFKPIKRANREKKYDIIYEARKYAKENNVEFHDDIMAMRGTAAYSVEFVAPDGEFYGWAIENDAGEIDFAFGPGQMIFDGEYVLTEEDYYEVIGAGV